MKQVFFILFMLLLISLRALPQTKELGKIRGRLLDKDTERPLEGATLLLIYTDSLVKPVASFSDRRGYFLLDIVKNGKCRLDVSFIGYLPRSYVLNVSKPDTILDMGIISMQMTGVALRMVEIVESMPHARLKEDTIEFDASYYKIGENALMEDLFEKLPGVQMEKDGRIKVNGARVKKILIDGKPFFADDPALAARNLSADIIEKVQVIDSKSEKEQFMGSNNERREKVINITVRKTKKNKVLATGALGVGTNERLGGRVNLNHFGDDHQISVLGGGNNTNGYLDGQGNMKVTSGSGNGVTRSWNGGVNFNNDFSEYLKINSNYILNNILTESQLSSTRHNLLPDTTYYYNQNSYTTNRFYSHSLDTRVEYNPDSMQSLIVNTNFAYGVKSDSRETNYESLGQDQYPRNSGIIRSSGKSVLPNLNISTFFGRKFKKPKRNLGVELNVGFNGVERERFSKSINLFVKPNGRYMDTIDQRSDFDNLRMYAQLAVTYAEPILRDHFVQFSYTYTWSDSKSEQLVYNYNQSKGVYDHLNDSLSNSFRNGSNLYLGGISVGTSRTDYDYSVGLNVLWSDLHNKNVSKHSVFRQSTINFYPTASFNYTLDNRQFSFSYGGVPEQPGFQQLQPVTNNSNPLYIQLGNPDLKVAFTHNFLMSYNVISSQTNRSFNANLNGAITSNRITTASWLDSLGRQITKPLNVNGCYTLNAEMESMFSLVRREAVIKTNTSLAFSRDVTYIEGIKRSFKSFSVTQKIGFGYTNTKIFDFNTYLDATYNRGSYFAQAENNVDYFSGIFSVSCNAKLPLGLTVGGNIDCLFNNSPVFKDSKVMPLLNAAISKKVLRNRQALLKLQSFDLLKKNLGVSRNVGPSYIEEGRTKVLQQFFMITISYSLKQKENIK